MSDPIIDDIDDIIDKAAAAKNDKDDIETMKQELEEKNEIIAKAQAKEEEDAQAKKAEQDAQAKKAEDDKLDPTMKAMKDKIEAMEAQSQQETLSRVSSEMATLGDDYPELMGNKDVMDAPIMPGSVTAREYLTDLITNGTYAEAKKAAETVMKLNEIKPKKTREVMPDGRGGSGGDASDTASKEVRERQEKIGKFFKAMQKGTLAREVVKARGS